MCKLNSFNVALSSLMIAGVHNGEVISAEFPVTIELSQIDDSNGFVVNGVRTRDYSGTSISTVGDINGDGLDDLLIGAPSASFDVFNDSGISYVIFGRRDNIPSQLNLSELDGVNGFTITGESAEDQSGHSVSYAGDVNGDGIDDLIIGAPFASPNQYPVSPGRSYVVFGKDSDTDDNFPSIFRLSQLTGSNGFKIIGNISARNPGFAVSSVGDVNNDGIDDVIVGIRLASTDDDCPLCIASVIYGLKETSDISFPPSILMSDLDGSNGFHIKAESAGDYAGRSVSGAGDINGDGIEDFIIGAYAASPNGSFSGRSYVVFGKDTTNEGGFDNPLDLSQLNGSNGFTIDGEASGDRAGRSVSDAGDINGDGLDDIIIGADGAEPNGVFSGRSYVVFGRNLVTQNPFSSPFQLDTLDGSNGFKIDGESMYDRSGWSVGRLGDVNSDGIDDLIIGALGASPNGINSGSSYVVFGRNTATSGEFLSIVKLSELNGVNGFKLNGESSGDISGRAVSAAGDINANGVSDIVIGASLASPNDNTEQAGRSYIIYGSPDIILTTGFE